jgi:multimeric flavodoxin WrbA
MPDPRWHDLGAADELSRAPLRQFVVDRNRIALSYSEGVFGAISGTCNHAGGPLGEGRLEGDYITCLLLEAAMDHAARACGAETRLIRLNDLRFRHCEGYYSKSAHACTWPCSITQMDPEDQLDQVYEAIVHWSDVLLLATPIRWGSASSLYYKMAERLNCVQNQITIRNKVLIRNKVAAFIVTGGQDNVQGVVGPLLTFFGELGFLFPQFPFVAHSRGWSAEDMENNVRAVQQSADLREGAESLADRAVQMAAEILKLEFTHEQVARGGRKAHHLA